MADRFHSLLYEHAFKKAFGVQEIPSKGDGKPELNSSTNSFESDIHADDLEDVLDVFSQGNDTKDKTK